MKKVKSHAIFIVTIDKGKKKLFKSHSSNFPKMKRFGKLPRQASVRIPNEHKKEFLREDANSVIYLAIRRLIVGSLRVG